MRAEVLFLTSRGCAKTPKNDEPLTHSHARLDLDLTLLLHSCQSGRIHDLTTVEITRAQSESSRSTLRKMHGVGFLVAALIVAVTAEEAFLVQREGDACSTWYENVGAHGPGFRNVKTYGAVGDGKTDDSAAIIRALTEGRNPQFSTKDPTVVYFPSGNYLISQTLPLYFYTNMVGNFACPPTLTVAPNLNIHYVIDSDVGDEGVSLFRGFSLKVSEERNVLAFYRR